MNPDFKNTAYPSSDGQPLERSVRSQPPPGRARPATALGATTGATAGAALALACAGPIAIPLGAIGGLVVGSLAGKGLAETRDPVDETQYWRERHAHMPFARGRPYDDFINAYRVGYQGFGRHQPAGTFDEREQELRDHYEELRGPADLPWSEAREAARAAWERLERNDEGIIGYIVVGSDGQRLGVIHTLWNDSHGTPLFAGMSTAWVFGDVIVLPLGDPFEAELETRTLKIPYSGDLVRAAPRVDPGAPLALADQERARQHFTVST